MLLVAQGPLSIYLPRTTGSPRLTAEITCYSPVQTFIGKGEKLATLRVVSEFAR